MNPMKRWLAVAVVAVGVLVSTSSPVWARCPWQTICGPDGRCLVCQTCTHGGSSTTFCG